MVGIPFSPFGTTTAGGSFNVDSTGYVQGTALDSPSIRNTLAGGILGITETLPMWGGVGICESVPGAAGAPLSNLGRIITRATTLTANVAGQLTGFSVFDQNYAMVNSPQSPVPMSGTYGQVNYYRLGSGARIAVQLEKSLAATLIGGVVTQPVSWDFNNQVLAPYESVATYPITSMTWSSANGGQVAVVANGATPVGGVGDVINISGATNSGSGGAAFVNGGFTVTAFTDNQHFIIALPATAGQVGTIGGTIVANYGVGVLPVRILDVNIGQSMTVNYNAITGGASWNRSGNTAIILI